MDAILYQLLQQGATLLTASRHLSHALHQEYAQSAQAQGLVVWPTPRIVPWSTYLRLACQQQRNSLTDAPRLLSEQQALALWERAVTEFNEARAIDARLLNPAQAARNAQRSWQRLHQYQIPLRKVAAYPIDEAQAFSGWAQRFVAITAAQGWLDSARFAGFLLEHNFQPDTPLIIYGFDRVVPDMQGLLQHWAAQGASIQRLEPPRQQARVSVRSAHDCDAELQAAARWARAEIEAGRQRIAIVVPRLTAQAAQVQRRFADVFAPAQRLIDVPNEPHAFRVVATPVLSSYSLVHHALLLLQLLQGRADVLLVGQLLRSPFFTGYDHELSERALAELAARDERREYWNCNELERLTAVHACGQLAACMQATGNYLREHKGNALPSEWTERFTQLLKLSGWSRGRTLDSNEQQTLNKFQQLLTELSALDELLDKISLNAAIGILRDACNAENFAPEGVDQKVTLIDADSVAGMQFESLWVMGMHAGDWPPAPEPDAFLPIELQRAALIPEASAAQALSLARQQLQRLIHAADEVVLSWPQHDDDIELRMSPLLDGFAAAEAIPIADNGALAQQLFAARPAFESFIDDFAPPLIPGAVNGGTRILELQSRCPFRAQAELRLFAQPVPTVSPAVEPTERGTLVHRVLTEVWQQLQGSDGVKALNLNDYAVSVRSIAQRIAQQVLPAATVHRQRLAALEVELCTQWVMLLLQVEAERLPFRVQRAEQIESYELAGLQIRIQLDRIDELPDGGKLLIDYKTGTSNHPSDWLDRSEPGRPRSPQLPLYALAHRQNLAGIAFAVLAPGKAEFRGLADTPGIAPGISDYASLKSGSKLEGIDNWDALLEHWQAVLNTLAQHYLSGAAYVQPLSNECKNCHLRSLCRVNELLESGALAAEQVDAEEDSDV